MTKPARKPSRRRTPAPATVAERCLWCGLPLDPAEHAGSTHPACRAGLIRRDRPAPAAPERRKEDSPDTSSGEI